MFGNLKQKKAPGLNGFPISFYRKCWETIKAGDLMFVISDFYERGFLDKGSNAIYIFSYSKERKGGEYKILGL